MLAHELRNPLAPIRTGLQVLRLTESKEVTSRTRTIMERQVTNLSRLIDDLLEVSRVTRGKIQLRRSNVDVWDILSHVAEARSRLAAEKGLTLRVHPLENGSPVDGGSLYVYADPTRLEQMIDNVLSNAVKFTPPGGNIQLRLAREDDEAVIRVRDSGIGIPSEMLSSVFELFTQTKHTLARTEGGLGIGLTVVRTLALLHDGTVEAVSEGEGKGTEIVIRLPALSRLAGQGSALEDAASVSRRSRKVLLIEDNRDTADLLTAYLRSLGHVVFVAHDGAVGLDTALRERPEVIICDIGLPGMDGFELGHALTAAPDLHGCMLIAITGYSEQRDRERGRLAGFQHYIVKPADPEEVARLVSA